MRSSAPPRVALALLLAALTLVVRAQTLGNPILGFDEQFYLLVGDRLLHGALPYVDIFDRKPVGLFLLFAATRRLGGDGALAAQLVAAAAVALTAGLLYRLARRIAPWPGALAAACAYPLWLDLTEGEGTQAELFVALPVTLAALLTMRAHAHPRCIAGTGAAAMLAIGLAIQMKYTALFEGLFLGVTLLWTAHRVGTRSPRLATLTALWIACALGPTLAAAAVYAHLGHLDAFVFANFCSLAGRLPDPPAARALGLAAILAVLAPLAVFVRAPRPGAPEHRFALAWALAAFASMLGFGAWLSLHYAQPVIVPLALVAAPALARHRRAATLLLGLALVAGQIVLFATQRAKGGRAEAQALAAAAQPRHGGCVYIYDGPPALYLLTHSCLPTRWPFPGHLDTANEASPAAIGTDPAREVRRILAARPEAIVDQAPAYALGNPQTRAILHAALARDYRLVLAQRTGSRTRLVYRLKQDSDWNSLPVSPGHRSKRDPVAPGN